MRIVHRTYHRRLKVMTGILGAAHGLHAVAMMEVAPGLGGVYGMDTSRRLGAGRFVPRRYDHSLSYEDGGSRGL